MDPDPEFYFIATLGTSTAQSGLLEVTEISEDYCTTKSICEDYADEGECKSDSCNFGTTSLPDIDCSAEDTICRCSWDDEAGSCGFAYTEITQDDCGDAETGCNYGCTLCHNQTSENHCNLGLSCPVGDEPLSNDDGFCDFGEGCLSDDCEDGERDTCISPYYCSLGKCSSIEGPPLSLGMCKVTQVVESECDEEPVGYKNMRVTGTWTGEETGSAYEKCIAMQNKLITVPCAAQIQLPLESWWGIIIVILALVIFYVIRELKKKKSKLKKSSKKRVKRKR